MFKLPSRPLLVCLICLAWNGLTHPCPAEELPYSVPDPRLQVQRVAHSKTDSFLSVRCDSVGRVFLGGRETLSVLDVDNTGKLLPRQELLRFPKDTWINDIEIRGNDLYLLTVTALYIVRDGRVQRTGLKAERLVWGVPLGHVHQGFHGLAWGPEGDLYISLGDQLWYYGDYGRPDHWGFWTFYSRPTQAPNSNRWDAHPYNGVGGFFRCHPDGSGFQVIARGTRNSCGLAFDHHWNLFSNENDHEGMPAEYVPGRLLHVTPHANFMWPRGWMPEKTPDRLDLLESMTTELGRAVPVGQSYYDDELLPADYRHALLVARWCTRKVTYYSLTRSGATFKVNERTLLEGKDMARPVGVTVGRGGRIWATISYMAQNEGSPIYQSDLVAISTVNAPAVHEFKHVDVTQAPPDQLYQQLSSRSWSERQQAHQEILRRGEVLTASSLQKLEEVSPQDPAWGHLLWLAGSSKTPEARRAILLFGDEEEGSGIALQALRALAHYYPDETTRTRLLSVLAIGPSGTADLLTKQAALTALFDRRITRDLPTDVLGLAELARKHSYIRQPLAFLIAERGTLDRIERMCSNKNGNQRLLGVLAAGFRLTIPPAQQIPDARFPLEPWKEKGNYEIEYADGKVDLKTLPGRIGTYTVAEHWKIQPRSPEQEALFALLQARLADQDEAIRLQSAYFLSVLNDPRSEPQVAKVRQRSAEQRLNSHPLRGISRFWTAGPFPDGGERLNTPHPPEQSAISLDATYNVGSKSIVWQKPEDAGFCNFRKIYGDHPQSSYYAYTRLESSRPQTIQLLVGSDDGVRVWLNGQTVWSNPTSRAALPLQDVVVVNLQAGSNELLVRVQNDSGESGLHLHVRAEHPLSDVLPEQLGIAGLADRLKQAAQSQTSQPVDPAFINTDWTAAIAKGNIDQGRKLFSAMGLGCAKCHALGIQATANAGPSLSDARKRFTIPYLVESVLIPSKQVSPVFKATLIVNKNGKTLTGLVVGETAEKLELLAQDGQRQTIPKPEIEERKTLDLSPMPQGLVKTPQELADLIAFILSDSGKQ